MQIWCPWVRSIFGELQYELLLGIFWENAYEPCSFGAEEPPAFPFGKAKPPCPPQTTALGVDKNAPPNWKFDVHIKSVYGVAEKLPPPGFLPLGYGPDLGRARPFLTARILCTRALGDPTSPRVQHALELCFGSLLDLMPMKFLVPNLINAFGESHVLLQSPSLDDGRSRLET